MEIKAIYNSRKPNGDVSKWACDICGKIGAAYINLSDIAFDLDVCQGCLVDWERKINAVIMEDVIDSVERRRRREENV